MDIEEIKKLSYEDLLNYCKSINFNVLTKQKKNKAHKTLIKELTTLTNKKEVMSNSDRTIEEPEIINEIIWKLDDDKTDDNDEYLKNKAIMNSIISKCHQLLYSNSISGRKAQADIMKIISIISLNSLITNENIDIDKLIQEKDIKINDEEKLNLYKSYLLDLTKILDSENIFNEWKLFIQKFVSKLFQTIIDSKNDIIFNITDEYAFRDLIKILCEINKNVNLSKDLSIICGDIYEYFLNYCGKGGGSKELGQFFTPRILINIFLNVCGVKELIASYDNPKIYDCCMGSGGFLSRTYISNNIKPENIYGNDYEDDIYKIAQSSLTILTKLGNINIMKCNSLSSKNPYLMDNDLKFEVILTNPPFATNITNMEDIKKIPNYKEIYPIDTKDGICQFIQMIIYKLKEGGICGIVLPDGKLLSNNQKTYLSIRKYIIKNARILKIINAESGVFENTGIKTSFILFQKGNYDNYNHKTEFYEIINKGKEVRYLGKSQLNKNLQFKFDYNLNEEKIEYNDNIEIKTLGEVCEIKIGGTPKRDNQQYYKDGNNLWISVRELNGGYIYDTKEKITDIGVKNSNVKLYKIGTILFSFKLSIGKTGIVGKDMYSNEAIAGINSIVSNLSNKYIYYYLTYYKSYKNANGILGNGSLNTQSLNEIKIPIPPMEIQEKMVEFLDSINEIMEDNKNKIEKLKKSNENYIDISLRLNKVEIKTLGEVCEFQNGYAFKSSEYEKYNENNIGILQIKGIQNGYIDNNKITEYIKEDKKYKLYEIYNGDILIALSGATIGKIGIYDLDKKSYLNQRVCKLNANININQKYIYYWYICNKINEKVLSISLGVAQPNISTNDLSLLKIPIPSIEVQNKIVEYLNNKNKIIKDLEKEIDDIKNEAEEFMKNSLL